MVYHTYNTEAFVLGALPAGESSRFVYLFTRDLGLVGARAQNARSVASKLRYALSDFSHSAVSLVRGKNSWRLVNAAPQKNFFAMFRTCPDALELTARILATVRMLVAGEEANPELYRVLEHAFGFLELHTQSAPELARDIKNIEVILMLRILDNLGYFGSHADLGQFVATPTIWSAALLAEMDGKRRAAVLAINNALKMSNL